MKNIFKKSKLTTIHRKKKVYGSKNNETFSKLWKKWRLGLRKELELKLRVVPVSRSETDYFKIEWEVNIECKVGIKVKSGSDIKSAGEWGWDLKMAKELKSKWARAWFGERESL